ncbi:nucleotide sugar dehydrogenase [bacterium]|nr:nucleotide sugar dehydrogenase [bacterium]NUN46115.1 nucleotide sugar dehydrogenase [bacterium]
MNLESKIKNKSAKVGIIGLGYVGLPLAVEFAASGYDTLGIDLDSKKVKSINDGHNYIEDIPNDRFQKCYQSGKLKADTTYQRIGEMDIIYICVPTPFTDNKEPDVSYIVSASEGIASGLRKEQLVILKSTTFPETTEKVTMPILDKKGLKVGADYYLAFSPERIDPGNKKYTTANTPVVVGGVTSKCTELACLINAQIIEKVVPVSNPRVAEMCKLLENIFRSVNIALVNELAQLCDRMGGVDMWEVINAAGTKPFGYMPFYPGPGIGGHCILIDPYYLSWKARGYDFHTNFIELAAEVNENMPYYAYSMIVEALANRGVALKKAKVLVLGAAFKKDVDDTRHSPSLKVMEIMIQKGFSDVMYNDPYVPEVELLGKVYKSHVISTELLKSVDVVFVGTDHSRYDYNEIVSHAASVVDSRNATKSVTHGRDKIAVLGSGKV